MLHFQHLKFNYPTPIDEIEITSEKDMYNLWKTLASINETEKTQSEDEKTPMSLEASFMFLSDNGDIYHVTDFGEVFCTKSDPKSPTIDSI
jgi:hypothetical protein